MIKIKMIKIVEAKYNYVYCDTLNKNQSFGVTYSIITNDGRIHRLDGPVSIKYENGECLKLFYFLGYLILDIGSITNKDILTELTTMEKNSNDSFPFYERINEYHMFSIQQKPFPLR